MANYSRCANTSNQEQENGTSEQYPHRGTTTYLISVFDIGDRRMDGGGG